MCENLFVDSKLAATLCSIIVHFRLKYSRNKISEIQSIAIISLYNIVSLIKYSYSDFIIHLSTLFCLRLLAAHKSLCILKGRCGSWSSSCPALGHNGLEEDRKATTKYFTLRHFANRYHKIALCRSGVYYWILVCYF